MQCRRRPPHAASATEEDLNQSTPPQRVWKGQGHIAEQQLGVRCAVEPCLAIG